MVSRVHSMTGRVKVVNTGCLEKLGGTETQLAMAVMALMRNEETKLIRQIKTLIKKHRSLACDILTADVDGWTPVHACALRGSRKLLKVYLSAGIDVNTKMGKPEGLPKDCTLLHMAALRGDKKILEYLLSKDAFVDCQDSSGATPVMYAAKRKNKKVVQLLAQHGANLSRVDFSALYDGFERITPHSSSVKFCFF